MRILLIIGLIMLSLATAHAETGVGDSPVFSLNTADLSGVDEQAQLPAVHRLAPCYPNPFNPSTTIEYYLARPGQVDLSIYDLKGRLVRALVSGESTEAGAHEAVWRGRDEAGHSVAGGVYLCRLKIDGFTFNQRMTLIK